MSFMEFVGASDHYGPKKTTIDTPKALHSLIENATELLYVIEHPRYKNVYAQVDHYLNMPILQGINAEQFGVVALKGDKLVIVQKKGAHWHLDASKTKIAKEHHAELFESFAERVSVLMA